MLRLWVKREKSWKTLFSVLLSCVILGGLLAGCGAKIEGGNAASEQQNSTGEAKASAEAAKGSSNEAIEERIVTDDLGHEVKLSATPKRVIAPYLEESLLKLGVIPVARYSNAKDGHVDWLSELDDVPILDFAAGMPSPEVVMSYEPDIIILHTETFAANGAYESYAKIAPTYVFKNASGNMEKSLTTIADLLGKSAEADTALQAYREKIKDAKEKLSKTTENKKVAIIRFAPKGVNLMGGNYLAGYLLHQELGLGKTTLVGDANSANLSLEVLPQLDADYIFAINQGGDRSMMDSPIWKSMPAVKQGHVYEVDNGYWLGSGLIAYEKIIDDVVRFLTK
ncbi:ABC transporter substrate-binding protein [Paenibacillus sp. HJL G12]|uniref:ABC transporter substrate-binding protein n=1 Tax=Paenibacillus dendrobii TaxID=2691084 RepID=A0A7X3LJC6_9BACL|nr:iron-siderophore ABC transporter substrate-binding protein [Paenibacillus dendrobii]MWV46115.1 ABC transporter substrate-binding protein [Paenibacillus dendrobii]